MSLIFKKKSLVCEGSGAKYNMWAVERLGSAQCVLLDVLARAGRKNMYWNSSH